MPSSTLSRGNILFETIISVSLAPVSLAAGVMTTVTASVPGSLVTDVVAGASSQAAQSANVVVQNVFVGTAGVMSIQFQNTTGVSVTTVGGIYTFDYVRPENQPLPQNLV